MFSLRKSDLPAVPLVVLDLETARWRNTQLRGQWDRSVRSVRLGQSLQLLPWRPLRLFRPWLRSRPLGRSVLLLRSLQLLQSGR